MPKFAANLGMMFNEVPLLERFAKAADAGSCIHDDDIVFFVADFQAGGVSSIFDVLLPRYRNRAS